MNHMVILLGGFYPKPSATGICAEKIIKLLQEEYDIEVICCATSTDVSSFSYKGMNIHLIGSSFLLMQNWLKEKGFSILLGISKIPSYIMRQFLDPNVLHWYVNYARKELEKIEANRHIDAIISFGAPMAAHRAVFDFRRKHPDIRWITCSYDSYGVQNKYRKRNCEYERQTMDAADCNLVSEEIFKNCKHLTENSSGIYLPFPYLINVEKNTNESSHKHLLDDKINLVYAGSFYKEIRNPEYLLKLVGFLQDDVVLHLFCSSDCNSLINRYVANSNGKIIKHPLVSQDTINEIYTEADVLVNVGNNLAEFKPSKTFEYISKLKPIINIYYDGFFDEVLSKYPYCIQICNSSRIEENINLVQRFINDSQNAKITEDSISGLMEKHGSKNILSILKKYLA